MLTLTQAKLVLLAIALAGAIAVLTLRRVDGVASRAPKAPAQFVTVTTPPSATDHKDR